MYKSNTPSFVIEEAFDFYWMFASNPTTNQFKQFSINTLWRLYGWSQSYKNNHSQKNKIMKEFNRTFNSKLKLITSN